MAISSITSTVDLGGASRAAGRPEPLPRRRPGRSAWCVIALLGAVVARAPAAPAVEDDTVRITLVGIWASERDRPAPLPRELDKHEKLLREKARTRTKKFNSFRLVERPAEKKVKPGQRAEYKLPKKYKLTLTPSRQGKHWILGYRLEREDSSWVSELRIDITRNKPCVILPPVQEGEEQLVLLLLYRVPGTRGDGDSAVSG